MRLLHKPIFMYKINFFCLNSYLNFKPFSRFFWQSLNALQARRNFWNKNPEIKLFFTQNGPTIDLQLKLINPWWVVLFLNVFKFSQIDSNLFLWQSKTSQEKLSVTDLLNLNRFTSRNLTFFWLTTNLNKNNNFKLYTIMN